jgi:hypothetical protein
MEVIMPFVDGEYGLLYDSHTMAKEPCRPNYEATITRLRDKQSEYREALDLIEQVHRLSIEIPSNMNIIQLVGHCWMAVGSLDREIHRIIDLQEKENGKA